MILPEGMRFRVVEVGYGEILVEDISNGEPGKGYWILRAMRSNDGLDQPELHAIKLEEKDVR